MPISNLATMCTDPRPVTYANNGWISWLDWLGSGRRYSGWRTYKEARAFVHQLRLKSVKGWIAYCASGRKPNDIPSNPNQHYANAGWVDWPDWIGNTRRIPSNGWRPFKKARAFVHKLGFKSVGEWRIYCRSGEKPADIPTAPERVYANAGWLDWRDWLGKTKPRNASGFRGIYAHRKTWKAQIVHQHIGSFDTPEEAARAYDAAAIKRWGARAVTNFPRPT